MKNQLSNYLLGILCLFFVLFSYSTQAQDLNVKGKIQDVNAQPLPGANVIVKGTNIGVVSDFDGNFLIKNVKQGSVLVISYIGFVTKEVSANSNNLKITLQEGAALEEVIVTGVFDKRTAMKSSVAISVLEAKGISKIAANSAADLLSYTPGVYVNSSVGEVNNTVYSRGVNANQFGVAGGNGFYYVGLFEDGLPVINLTSGNSAADYFYRADGTLKRLESVRGGSASITGNNSPGGIFNYVSHSGKEKYNMVSLKSGLEGNGKNPFTRFDANLGGAIGEKGWYYNVGGFYRSSEGARSPGYQLNKGGQIKANILKEFGGGGFVKFYAKYLNDRNALPQALPAKNYNNPELALGFTNTDTQMLPAASSVQPNWSASPGSTYEFDPSNLNHSTEIMVGNELELKLGKGWSFNNNVKFSHKTKDQSIAIFSTPTDLESLLTYALMGMVAPGTIQLKDRSSGQLMAEINADFTFGPKWQVTQNNLPNQGELPNNVFFNMTNYSNFGMNELIDQFSFNKKAGKHSLTLGSFTAISHNDTYANGTANTSLRTMVNRSSPLDVTLTLPGGGPTLQVTDPNGYAQLSGGRFAWGGYESQQNQYSVFLADGIQASDKLNIDLGIRFDQFEVNGKNRIGKENPNSAAGGIDGNPLTLYDNYYFVDDFYVPYKTSLSLVSYSAGVNYQMNNNNAVYGRFSRGKKAPDMQFYYDNYSTLSASPEVKAQTVTQLELGYKFKSPKISGSIIPFYSRLSDIPVSSVAQLEDNTSYFTDVVFNTLETFGLEAEVSLKFTDKFNLNANATLQSAKAKKWQSWVIGSNGRADDALVNNNGNKAENSPAVMFNISPNYNFKKGYLSLNYQYMGDREANMANAFTLPGFGQLNFSAGYDLSPKLTLLANINNLTNTFGVMNWMAPSSTTLVDAFSHNSVTPARVASNPNEVFQVVAIQPRAYFLTLKYEF
ncbi:MAG: hypothetical protein RLZZ540_2985 [Bacteroidota bacterium]|jgi:outer membrane receptor protein involved in Fe transport